MRYRWRCHAGIDNDTFGNQVGECAGRGGIDCGWKFRLQDEAPGSLDGHPKTDWSLFSEAPDGTRARLEYRVSNRKVYDRATAEHAAVHAAMRPRVVPALSAPIE